MPGPFGTYDMGGDQWQWNETPVDSSERGVRGGGWYNPFDEMERTFLVDANGPTGQYDVGFRVASVPWGWHDPGDANGDGQVDINDLTIVLSNFGKTGVPGRRAVWTATPPARWTSTT